MKKTAILVVTIVVVTILNACKNTPEDKAKALIKDYLSKNMNDFKSYEAVEFGSLDSLNTEFDESKFLSIDTSISYNQRQADSIIASEKAKFKPEFEGYMMTHVFRGKNSFGSLVLNKNAFLFDENLTEVVDIIDMRKED